METTHLHLRGCRVRPGLEFPQLQAAQTGLQAFLATSLGWCEATEAFKMWGPGSSAEGSGFRGEGSGVEVHQHSQAQSLRGLRRAGER